MLFSALGFNILEWDLLPLVIVNLIWLYILRSVALFLIFRKMGETPWKAFVPFYGFYFLCKRVWITAVFWQMLCFLCPAVVFEILNLCGVFSTELIFYFCIGYDVLCWLLVIIVRSLIFMQLCKAFKEHISVWIVMVFLPTFMLLKVALEEKNFYKGPVRFYKKRPLNITPDGTMFELDLAELDESKTESGEVGVKFK